MNTIHIQEADSTQVTEIIALSIKDALFAYARNAAFNWDELHHCYIFYYDNTTVIDSIVYCFTSEVLTIKHIMGARFLAEWKDII
jgi:hypothetical protein